MHIPTKSFDLLVEALFEKKIGAMCYHFTIPELELNQDFLLSCLLLSDGSTAVDFDKEALQITYDGAHIIFMKKFIEQVFSGSLGKKYRYICHNFHGTKKVTDMKGKLLRRFLIYDIEAEERGKEVNNEQAFA